MEIISNFLLLKQNVVSIIIELNLFYQLFTSLPYINHLPMQQILCLY